MDTNTTTSGVTAHPRIVALREADGRCLGCGQTHTPAPTTSREVTPDELPAGTRGRGAWLRIQSCKDMLAMVPSDSDAHAVLTVQLEEARADALVVAADYAASLVRPSRRDRVGYVA